jgi:hypothetical protein
MKKYIFPISAALLLTLFTLNLTAQEENETCLMCHSDPDLETERGGKSMSMFVDADVLAGSAHAGLACIDCHQDADVDDFPHEENLEDVFCGMCHDEVMTDFEESAHGLALRSGALYAPSCAGCHGSHDIKSHTVVASPTYKMSIPYLCGGCHREGAPVARFYDISEKNIIENYGIDRHGHLHRLPSKSQSAAPYPSQFIGVLIEHCHDLHEVPYVNREGSPAGYPRGVVGRTARGHTCLHRLPPAA